MKTRKAVPQVVQTFRERIADQNKVPLCEDFIATIERLAVANGKSEDEVYALWRKYSEDCRNYDQSAFMSEFVEWNKLKLEPTAKAVPQTAHTLTRGPFAGITGVLVQDRQMEICAVLSRSGNSDMADEVAQLFISNAELLKALDAMLAYGDSEFPANKTVAVEMAFAAIAKTRGGAQ